MRRVAAQLDERWRAHAAPAWLAAWTPRRFDLGDGLTEVVAMGAGPTLVLLPPLPGWKELWAACAAPLARRFRVVTFDLRVRFAPGPRWPQWVADTRRVVDAFAPGRFALAGHSLGGALAQHVALALPGRVTCVALSSTFARVATPRGERGRRFVEQPLVLAGQRWLPEALAGPLARRLAAAGAWVYDPHCDAATLALVRFAIRHASAREIATLLTLAFAHDTRATLAALEAPALILRGGRERGSAVAATDELRRLLPEAAAAVLPDVGHLHPLTAPDALAARLATFVEAHLPSPSHA